MFVSTITTNAGEHKRTTTMSNTKNKNTELTETEMYQEIISFVEETDSPNIMRNMFIEFLDNRCIRDLYENYKSYIKK